MYKGRTTHRHIRSRLHCWCVLRHRFPPSRCCRVKVEPSQGSISFGRCQEIGLHGHVERFDTTYYHDRNPHRPPVVHLRRSQGRARHPTSTTNGNARVSQEEARRPINSFTSSYSLIFHSIAKFPTETSWTFQNSIFFCRHSF